MEYPISYHPKLFGNSPEDQPSVFLAELVYRTGFDVDELSLGDAFEETVRESKEIRFHADVGKWLISIHRHEGALWVIFRDDGDGYCSNYYVARPVTEEEKKAVVAQLDYLRERSDRLKPIFSEGG